LRTERFDKAIEGKKHVETEEWENDVAFGYKINQ